jgi:hypothetical protein
MNQSSQDLSCHPLAACASPCVEPRWPVQINLLNVKVLAKILEDIGKFGELVHGFVIFFGK